MIFTPRVLATVALLIGACVPSALADTFTYSWYENPYSYFTVTTPTLVATPTTFYSNISCSALGYNQCTAVYVNTVNDAIGWFAFFPPEPFDPLGIFDSVAIPAADFLAPGTYEVYGHPFSIVDNPSGVTPEPSSLILVVTGIFGVAEAMRRRYFTA